MKNFRFFAWLTLAAGIAAAGTSTLSAQDWHNVRQDRQDVRQDYRSIDHDYDRVNRIRAEIASDQARLNEDLRCGRRSAAAWDAQALARDRRELYAQASEVRYDRFDAFRDHQDIRRDTRDWR